MISEFVGPPGSGKSAVAHSFAARYGGRVLKLNGFGYGESLSRSATVLTQLPLTLRAARLDRRRAINLARRSRLMSTLPDERLWIEDGPLFALSRMLTDDVTSRQIAGLVRRLRLPDQCVIVHASATTCLRRLTHLRNGNNRLVQLETSQAVTNLEHLRRATDRLVACLPTSIEVTQVSNDEDADLASLTLPAAHVFEPAPDRDQRIPPEARRT